MMIGVHANLRYQDHGDRNSRGHDLVGKRDGEGEFGRESREVRRMLRKRKRGAFLIVVMMRISYISTHQSKEANHIFA